MVGLSAAACSRRATTEGAAPAPAVVPVPVATVKSQEQPVTIEYTAYSLAKGQNLRDAVLILLDLFARRLYR